MRRFSTLLLVLLAVSLRFSDLWNVVGAVAGDLDPGFGTGGKVTTDFLGGLDQAYAIAIQPNGRLVVAGRHGGPTDVEGLATDFALARYDADGALDPGFGTNGRIVTDLGGSDAIRGVVVQPDGKIVAGGNSSGGLALARYNEDGSLDSGFGPNLNGKLVDSWLNGSAVALQADGRIVAAGTANFDFGLARYNTDGSVDITFGLGFSGRVSTDFGHTEFASALAIQPADGKLIVAGSAQNPSTGVYHFALARYNTNGSLDSSFGASGRVVTSVSAQDFANAMAIQPDGKIVVAGSWQDLNGLSGFSLVRYKPNGTLDTTFGTGGSVLTVRSGVEAHAVAIQSDGRIVAAGASRFLLMAYNADGSADTAFGPNGNGQLVTDFGGGGSQANAVALQPDGRLIAAGAGNGRNDFAVARYDMTRPPNKVPVLDVGFGSTITEGQRFGSVGSFTDPDSTSWTATVDYGDGTGLRELPLFDGTSFFLNHAYQADGAYTITVCVTDDHGATACGSIGVLVTVGSQFGAPLCVHDVAGQFGALKHHGEALGFHLGAGTPTPTLSRHYQGMVRRPGSGPPRFFVSRSGNRPLTDTDLGGDDPGNLLVVRFNSRNTAGERMRSNRLGAHRTTEDTPPPTEDVVVENFNFNGGADANGNIWPSYGHVGGMQIFEDVLFVPLEARKFDWQPKVELALVDISIPEAPKILKEIPFPDQQEGSAGVAAVARQPGTGLLLLIVPGPDSESLHVYKSNVTDIRDESFTFNHFDTWFGDELVGGEWPTDHDFVVHGSNQSLYLVDDCVNGLYLMATRNSAGGSSFPDNEDHAALYRVSVNDGSQHFGLTKIDDLHIWCESADVGQICDLAAAAGFYVSPAGELLLYASEHQNGGPDGTVRMAEFHNRELFRRGSPDWAPTALFFAPPVIDVGSVVALDGSPSVPPVAKAWVELYEDENFEDRSLVLDWEDRFRGEYASLGDLDDWDDEADSLIYASPVGCDLHVYEDPHFGGKEVVFSGTGRVRKIANLNDDAYDIGDEIDSIQFIGSTCNADAMTYAWDLDDDGTFETPGISTTLQPSTTTRVALRVCSAFYLCDEALMRIEVHDFTPSISSFLVPPQADEGEDIAATGTISNPGNRSLTSTVDWGDGHVDSAGTFQLLSHHTYADNGTYTVRAQICDTGQHCDTSTRTVVVRNAVPVVAAGADVTIHEGATLSRSVTFSDAGFTSASAGTHESFAATADWGDNNSATVPLSSVPGGPGVPTTGIVPTSHSYADDGIYTLTVRVLDDDGGIGSDTVAVRVDNLPPVAQIVAFHDETGRLVGASDVVLVGLRVDFSGSFTDPGLRDTHTASVNWGDNTSSAGVVVQARREVSASHVYTAPSASLNQPFHFVRLSVHDDDGGVGQVVAHLAVVDPADAVVKAVANLQALANGPTLPRPTKRALLKAVDELQGNQNGSDGALGKLADGNLVAAVNKLGQALDRLQTAAAASPSLDLAGTTSLLVLTAKAIAVDAIRRAQAVAVRPRELAAVSDANARLAEGDALLAIGKNIDAVNKYEDAVRRVRHLL